MGSRPPNGELTFKENLLLKNLVKHKGNKTQAGLATFDTKKKHNASEIVKRTLQRPVVAKAWQRVLERAGLTDETLADKWQEAVSVGWGKNATHKDALKALTEVTKMKHKDSNMKVDVNVKHEISGMAYDEVKKLHEEQVRKSQKLIEDAEVVG